ncbi:MAG: DinB family protein [Acidobacteriales bacterium]|nr:DinB family protein [Terriglobales bacterium]
MKETPQQYVARILGNVEGRDPLAVLEATPNTLNRLLNGRPEELLRRAPAPGKWSAAQIAAHLADVEVAVGWRIRLVLGSPGTPIQGFDQDSWAAAEKYNDIPVSLALQAHSGLRALNLRLFRSLSAEQWELFGMHSERGQESVRRIVTMLAGHDINHLRQIEAIVARARATA